MTHDYLQLLKSELSARQFRNSSYSMRAFARDIGVSATALSDVLNGKRNFSKSNIDKISNALQLTQLQKQYYFAPSKISSNDFSRLILEEDTFRCVADWYYFAILNLAKIKNNSSNPVWIAERLALTVEEVNQALQRLTRLKFIKIQKGKLIRTTHPLGTLRDIPSLAVKKHHTDNLKLASEALVNVPIEDRDYSSTTMAISKSQLKQAKEYLLKAKQKVGKILEKDEPDSVYVFSYQLFPVENYKKKPTDSKDKY